jgi:hypothetical protein
VVYVYAGIDEAGYGPSFGPLLVGRAVLALAEPPADGQEPNLWKLLKRAVCKTAGDRRKRLAVNDSKKLHSQGTPNRLRHLELGVLTFAALAGYRPRCVGSLLDGLGESCHRELAGLPWYEPCEGAPWASLPVHCTEGELAVSANMLAACARESGLQALNLGAAVVFEDRFNRMVMATRSKASASFTFVGKHLSFIWENYGAHHPRVVVDRQSGRMRYRELLAMLFPGAKLCVIDESAIDSVYCLEGTGEPRRLMTVRFQVDSEQRHLPTALASMISKYVRELLMLRFQAYFTRRAPRIEPTAGYGADAKRFWREIEPLLTELSISPDRLRRLC